MEINGAAPVSAKVSAGYQVCQPPLCAFVFVLYVCMCVDFFLLHLTLLFFQYFVTKEPKPCLKYFTISNDKCTPGHLPKRAPNTKGFLHLWGLCMAVAVVESKSQRISKWQ